MKHIKLSPFFVLAVLLAYLSKNLHTFLITYASLLFHEGVHLLLLCKKQILIHKIVLEPFGISIETEQSAPKSIGVYLWAPLCNLLAAGAIWFLYQKNPFPYGGDWFFANLLLGSFNLIPCLPLDGGRALELYLARRFGEVSAKQSIQMLSLSLSALVIVAGLWLMWYTKYNISLVIIGIFLLYTALSQNRLTLEKNICNRTKIKHLQDALPVCYLCANWDSPARKVIGKFRGDRYYIVNVIKNGEIIKTVTETGILQKLLSCDGNLLLYEC
ncbi:MAG: hypothetical protein IJ367_01870 [Clostridia bacterium]|nr:hypothetical protein [Clostridia bacterium]